MGTVNSSINNKSSKEVRITLKYTMGKSGFIDRVLKPNTSDKDEYNHLVTHIAVLIKWEEKCTTLYLKPGSNLDIIDDPKSSTRLKFIYTEYVEPHLIEPHNKSYDHHEKTKGNDCQTLSKSEEKNRSSRCKSI
jgi:hypothetical protein